jgi:hypothetical protein
MRRAPPRLAELAIRLLLVGAPLVTAVSLLQTTLIRPLLPLYGATVVLLAPQFTLQSLNLVQSRLASVQVRANLLEPVEFARHTVVPIGWLAPGQQGGYEVSLSLTGLLQYPTLALLILLAWPAADLRVLGTRLLLAVPIAALLLVTEAPTTIVAELWSVVRNQADPGAVCYWMVWSRFLMGGGGLLIAGILGASGVIVAQRLQRAPSPTAFA